MEAILQSEGLGMSNVLSSEIGDICNAFSIDSSNVVSEQMYDQLEFHWCHSEKCHAKGLHFVQNMLLNC